MLYAPVKVSGTLMLRTTSKMAKNSMIYIYSQFDVDKISSALSKSLTVIRVKPSNAVKTRNWQLKVSPEDLEKLKESEILIADNNLISQIMYLLPNLKWVQGTWAGVDPIIKAIDRTKPFPSFILTRCSTQYFGDAMAEYALAQVLNWSRKLFYAWDFQKEKKWGTETFLTNLETLRDMTIGVLGVGVIGSPVAKAFKQRGSQVIGFARTPRDKATYEKMGFDNLVCDLSQILPHCDFIINVLPSTSSTAGLLNGDILKMCSKKPVFINIGRGSIIKEEDLIRSLKEGWLSGAVLDVFENEPLPESSPLWTTPNVIITPHIGCFTRLSEVSDVFNENYQRYISGQKLLNVVDWSREY